MMAPRSLLLAAALVAATSLAWLDPHQPVRDANRLYDEGKYDDAAAAYNAALVDHPDSADLHFNLGDATYKQGKYDGAVAAFQKVETNADPKRASRVAYNVGNAMYRQGQALEQSDPQKALGLYGEALASYRRALGLTPDDEDTKFNHELVTKHIDDLKKKLEEQKKEQDQKKQDQQQQKDQQQQDQQKQDQQQQGDQQKDQEQKADSQKTGRHSVARPETGPARATGSTAATTAAAGPSQQDQQQAGGEDQQKKDDQQKQDQAEGGGQPNEQQAGEQQKGEPAGDAVAGEKKKDGELSKGEAAAILDSQRGEEVSPEDVIKKLQGARVAEPAQDW